MKVSIVIPAFNVESCIEKTLESLINQTERDFEVVIVDDGSADYTYQLIEDFILNNNLTNFKLFKQNNKGVSSARNEGIRRSSGDYIIFLDGDDFISEELVKTLYNILIIQNPDVLCWGYNIVSNSNVLIKNYFDQFASQELSISGNDILHKIIIDKALHIWTGSAAYKKEMLLNNNIQFTEGCSNGEDQEFIIRSILDSKKVFFINKVLSYYVQREGSISNSYNIKRFDAINAMKRICENIETYSDVKLVKISNKIKYEKIIEDFMYNYNSCMIYLLTQRKLSIKNSLVYINDDIELNYPGLLKMIKSLMKNYSGGNIKLHLRIMVYLYLPIIYYKFIFLSRD